MHILLAIYGLGFCFTGMALCRTTDFSDWRDIGMHVLATVGWPVFWLALIVIFLRGDLDVE